MGTKNSSNKNRSKAIQKKKHNGKEIIPVRYCGRHYGHGEYITAKYFGDNQLVSDENGRPIPWGDII